MAKKSYKSEPKIGYYARNVKTQTNVQILEKIATKSYTEFYTCMELKTHDIIICDKRDLTTFYTYE